MSKRVFVAFTAALFLCLALACGECRARISVRVMVMDNLEQLSVHFPATYDVKDVTGLGVVSGSELGGSSIVLGPDTPVGPGVRVSAQGSVVSINRFALTGVVDIKKNARGLYRIINELDLEDYVRAVVGEEMDPRWPLEALKAQAVAARTYTLYRKSNGGAGDYDLCSTVNSQVFAGDAWQKDGPALAVSSTRGQVLTYRGGLAETLYHGSCGGMTEDASDVWDRDCGYLKPVACECNFQSPYARWRREISPAELEDALVKAGYRVSGVSRVSVVRRSGSGRAAMVSIAHSGGVLRLAGNEFRKAVGYGRLPSTYFSVENSGREFVFRGSGSGHGVGLCQWGAKVMAEQGYTYEQILKHYYPELDLSRVEEAEAPGR